MALQPAPDAHPRPARQERGAPLIFWLFVWALTVVVCFAVLAPGRIGAHAEAHEAGPALVDQHFSGCNDARAAGRINIPSSDPSYRTWMDGDRDGLACEPHRIR